MENIIVFICIIICVLFNRVLITLNGNHVIMKIQ